MLPSIGTCSFRLLSRLTDCFTLAPYRVEQYEACPFSGRLWMIPARLQTTRLGSVWILR